MTTNQNDFEYINYAYMEELKRTLGGRYVDYVVKYSNGWVVIYGPNFETKVRLSKFKEMVSTLKSRPMHSGTNYTLGINS